jgi:hypothetical protein
MVLLRSRPSAVQKVHLPGHVLFGAEDWKGIVHNVSPS